MKKNFKLEDLDCPNCASKMEKEITNIDGVESAAISLLSQKLVIECDENKLTDTVKLIKKIVKKYEPDVEVIEL